MLLIMEAVDFLHESGEPATLPHTLIIHTLKCYINCARICIHRSAQQDDDLTIVTLYMPDTCNKGPIICTLSCRTNKATGRPHTPTIREGKVLTVRIRAKPPQEGMDGVKEEERMKQGKEKWEKVYIHDEPLCGGHHLQRSRETGRMKRLDSTPASARPQAAP